MELDQDQIQLFAVVLTVLNPGFCYHNVSATDSELCFCVVTSRSNTEWMVGYTFRLHPRLVYQYIFLGQVSENCI
jgi:hypothetical protein